MTPQSTYMARINATCRRWEGKKVCLLRPARTNGGTRFDKDETLRVIGASAPGKLDLAALADDKRVILGIAVRYVELITDRDLRLKVLTLLQDNPTQSFTLYSLAKRVGASHTRVKTILDRRMKSQEDTLRDISLDGKLYRWVLPKVDRRWKATTTIWDRILEV